MAVNLSRNTKVYFCTVPAPTSGAQITALTAFEIQVMDGYTFTQNTEQQTIQLSEAGTSPIRGERSFNSKLNPVDWSFSTYIRPYKSTNVMAPEKFLWNAIFGSRPLISPATRHVCSGTATISGTTASGFFATITATAAHGLAVGDAINVTSITGLSGSSTGNGTFRITAIPTTAQITYSLDTFVSPTGTSASAPQYLSGQWYESTANAITTVQGSNKNQLQAFSLIFLVDNTYYVIENCAVNQAEITFDLNGIAMISWSGFGTKLQDRTTFTGMAYTVFPTSPVPQFITNKLSTTTLISKLGGNDGSAGTTYTVPITGGTLTINNNIEYLTPEILGAVNTPIGYFAGSRSITGTLNAYLKTGTNESAQLMTDILNGLTTTSETKYRLQVEIGGLGNTTRVEVLMPYCQLQVPTVDVQDVVSTAISFTAQGGRGASTGTAFDQNYDIEATNNLTITYVTP
jgi:hypothetical protein